MPGDPEGLTRAAELTEARGASAQLWVAHEGRVVLDRCIGCGPNDLFWIFSASKPFVTVLLYQLVETGEVELDAPVARYWPEFAAHGKGGITLRHVLRHRSGLPVAGRAFLPVRRTASGGLAGGLATRAPLAVAAVGDVVAMTDWGRSVRRIERARPLWPPGEVPAYEYVDYGFILGEVVRRVAGRPVRALLRERVLDPLGLADTSLGLPRAELRRAVPMRGRGAMGRAVAAVVNRPAVRTAPIPAAGISTTARDLGTFYLALLRAGRGEGGATPVLTAASLAEMTAPSCHAEVDRFVGVHIRWAQGMQLGGPRLPPLDFSPMGRRSSPRTFGHNGSNVAIGWADPERDVVFAYVNNLATGYVRDYTHLAEVADAVLAWCG